MSTKTENPVESWPFAKLHCDGGVHRVLGEIRSMVVATIVARSVRATKRWSDGVSDQTLRDLGLERTDITTLSERLAEAREQVWSRILR